MSYNEDKCITFVTALGSSYRPASIATWPGRDSVGTRVCDMPSTPGKYLYQQKKIFAPFPTGAASDVPDVGRDAGRVEALGAETVS